MQMSDAVSSEGPKTTGIQQRSFESLLVFILFKSKKRPYISGIRVV